MNSRIEALVSGLKTFMISDFPAYVSSANSGTTGVQCQAIKNFCISTVLDPTLFPQVQIMFDNANMQASASNAQMVNISISINLGMTAGNAFDRAVLLMRYADAMIDFFGDNETLNGLCVVAQLDELDTAIPTQGDAGFIVSRLMVTDEIQTN